ncbi:putative transcriptional regulator, IclR family protein [Kineosporia sp. NBRC 101677]|uniref:IclR family transcriptional regulator n=1 Tax=Kineosporia sp. NBRC 101677 TaxID=3032197 RepID=UPI0024A13A43|nr:helix-turn-helix domain-containing protein [Kineosporia sp. NBRC 101677]GLY19522.1 putative transcriptional regulator, IclR family protein [Kineosporia sp. NBRC 101677]
MADGRAEGPLQTLSRGIAALEVLAAADEALSIGELATRLGLHRSITYRIVRTLEHHGLVARDAAGDLVLGAGLATLARNVSRDLQTAVLPELTAIANECGMTAFLTILDGQEIVTLISVEPRAAVATVAQRPGTRHALDRGAPGRAVQRVVGRDRGTLPYETSHDEVTPGLSSIAVPLDVPGQQPAAIAVVYLTGGAVDVAAIGERLAEAATIVRKDFR